MFEAEEKNIRRIEQMVSGDSLHDERLYSEYMELAQQYRKLFKQFKRAIKIGDRQQIELKKSRESILRYNRELQREIQERKRAEHSLQRCNMELQRMASLDGLTQIANRRRFDEYMIQQWALMARGRRPISLILSDIDYFKRYNDNYGHQAGDETLKKVAKAMEKAAQRPADLAARVGGEEFAIILPDTRSAGAHKVAQNLLSEIENLCISHCDSPICEILTLSVGISVTFPEPFSRYDRLFNVADHALYEAKETGRNRIVLKKEMSSDSAEFSGINLKTRTRSPQNELAQLKNN